MNPPRFALIGAAGFVAPRHLEAIKHVGGKLVAALDPHDSVGRLDSFDRDTDFFTDEYRFRRHLDKLRHRSEPVDWLSVCSPNYLHDEHIRLGLYAGAKVICEKPIVVNPDNLDILAEDEAEFTTGGERDPRRVFTVLQLRHDEEMKKLRAEVQTWPAGYHKEVDLRYITPRGRWYDRSWKGDAEKSGGILTNIGVHMFDLLLWLFGPVVDLGERGVGPRESTGRTRFERANVHWHLSINYDKPERTLSVGGKTWSVGGFENLHATVYAETLAGRGHGIEDARPAIELISRLR